MEGKDRAIKGSDSKRLANFPETNVFEKRAPVTKQKEAAGGRGATEGGPRNVSQAGCVTSRGPEAFLAGVTHSKE